MKLVSSLLVGLLAAYLALIWATGHLDALSTALCAKDFNGPGLLCRFAGLGLTLLAVPAAGVLGFVATSRLWRA
jgi:hypothetical protein